MSEELKSDVGLREILYKVFDLGFFSKDYPHDTPEKMKQAEQQITEHFKAKRPSVVL